MPEFEIQKDHSPEYHGKLNSLLNSSKKWALAQPSEDHEKDIMLFMDSLSDLYLDYFQFHLEEVPACTIDFQELLPKIFNLINQKYIYPMWVILNSGYDWDENWEFACQVMTNIESFNAMFKQFTGKLEASPIIEYVEERRGRVMTDHTKIPKGVPDSHW